MQRRFVVSPALFAVILIGCAIAAVAPFDVIIAAITFGSAAARIAVLAALTLAGWAAASRSGLRLEGHGAKYPVLVGIAAAFGVATYVALVDCYLFRSAVSAQNVHFLHQPLGMRLAYFTMRSFNENIIYRLFLFSILLFALNRFRAVSPVSIIAAMLLAQFINIGANVMAFEHFTTSGFVYDSVRYVAPGTLWAWIYFRFGFATAEIAMVGCHVFLQPMYSVFLR